MNYPCALWFQSEEKLNKTQRFNSLFLFFYFQIHYVVQQKSYKNVHTQEADSMSVWFQNKSSCSTAYSLNEEPKLKQTKEKFNEILFFFST